MRQRGILIALLAPVFILLSSCAALQYGDEPNYSLCKQLETQIQFGRNTRYSPEARSDILDKKHLQNTYEKLNCSKYQWFKFNW